MTTTTDKLAEALRNLWNNVESTAAAMQRGHSPYRMAAAADALAEYEAERAAHPTPEPVKVVVAIGGGCLRSVHSDTPLDVTLFDFDNQEDDEDDDWREGTHEAATEGMEDYS